MLNFTPRQRLLALILLLMLYGLCLGLLQTFAPELVAMSLWITIGILVVVGGVTAWVNRRRLIALLWNFCLLPIHFYAAGVAHEPAAPRSEATTISVVISAALCAGIIFVPLLFFVIPILGALLVVSLLAMVLFAWNSNLDPLILPRRMLTRLKTAPPLSTVTLPRLRWWIVVVELGVIVITTALTTRPFYESPANWQLSGNEVEWLTSTVAAAYTGLHESGRIPRWQPYLSQGEPVIENPFNFIFNPFASAPSLLLGPVAGLRISVILGYFLAGLGGWFLGRTLGFGALGRVLLAMLMIGKGNMHAMMNTGYYQLALSQIYMPYVIGGVIAIFRWSNHPWPVVLTGLALALQFLSGNIWYLLPTAVGAVCVGTVLLVGLGKPRVDWAALKRLLLAATFAIGLSAVVALPVVLQFKQLGRHPDEINGGWAVPLPQIVQLYFDPNPDQSLTVDAPVISATPTNHTVKELDRFYYSFIIPAWFVLLILFVLPLYRPVRGREQHIWWVALTLCGLATLWGAGGKQPILLLYQHIPLLAQWRYVGRALAVGSFWLAVLVAIRLDNLWQHIVHANWSALLDLRPHWAKIVPVFLCSVLIVLTVTAGAEVNDQWYKMDHIVKESDVDMSNCVTWLRQQYPDEPLTVWQQRYNEITTYLNNGVRTWSVAADFTMLPQPSTLGSPQLDLNAVKPQYAQIKFLAEVLWPFQQGYHLITDSPSTTDVGNCLFERDDSLPYAYTVTRTALESMSTIEDKPVIDLKAFSPVRLFERRGDQVALIVTDKRSEPTIVGVQESAYPGWRVEVDGQAAQIESVGGQIGVVLPAGDQPVQIYFVYDPVQPVFGGLITLITAFGCVIYLLMPRRMKDKLFIFQIKTYDNLDSYEPI